MAQLSDNAIKALADFIESQSREWVEQYIQERKSVLEKRKILASGELRDSFAFSLTKRLNESVTNAIELEFNEYGRFIEMKRLNVPGGGEEYLNALAAWIIKKGLQDKMTQGFVAKRNLRAAPPNVLRSLAWAIAVNRTKKYRRRSWYAKSKSAAVTDLFNRVAAGIPDIVLDELKKAFA